VYKDQGPQVYEEVLRDRERKQQEKIKLERLRSMREE
jgi:hypothetical protein